MKRSKVLGWLAGLMLLAACGSHDSSAATAQDSLVTVVTAPASKEKWMVLKYDDLRLRDAPSKTGAILATFKEGTKVLDLGERSTDLETIELRGEKITAPWAKVRVEGKEGWIFAGALGPAPDPSVAAFANGLEKLAQNDCKSIRAALDAYANAMKGKAPEVADLAAVPLFDFLENVVMAQNEQLSQVPDIDALTEKLSGNGAQKPDAASAAKRAAWEACGLELRFPEGMLDLELKPGLAIPILEPLVSKGMRRYLEICKKEDANPWNEDGGMVISPKELADRVVNWDVFLSDYPDFVFKKQIRVVAYDYRGSLLVGQDNTPAFNYESGKIEDNRFKEAWDWVLKSNPTTETARIVGEWCDILKANNWKRGPKAEKYLQAYWKSGE